MIDPGPARTADMGNIDAMSLIHDNLISFSWAQTFKLMEAPTSSSGSHALVDPYDFVCTQAKLI